MRLLLNASLTAHRQGYRGAHPCTSFLRSARQDREEREQQMFQLSAAAHRHNTPNLQHKMHPAPCCCLRALKDSSGGPTKIGSHTCCARERVGGWRGGERGNTPKSRNEGGGGVHRPLAPRLTDCHRKQVLVHVLVHKHTCSVLLCVSGMQTDVTLICLSSVCVFGMFFLWHQMDLPVCESGNECECRLLPQKTADQWTTTARKALNF